MSNKRWPHLSYNGQPRLSYDGGKFYQPASLGDKPVFNSWDTARWKTQAGSLSHPTPNSDTDPVTLALVLDCLLRMEHDTVLRATPLSGLLNEHYPQIKWDPVTVGKILSAIAEAARGGPGFAGRPGIEMAIESNGRRAYGVNVSSDFWGWLGIARSKMGLRAQSVVNEERSLRQLKPRGEFPWDIFEEATKEYAEFRAVAAS
jgi:hypothetical protein